MPRAAVAVITPAMRKVQARLARWRKSRRPRAPIPESLWDAAAEVAREHGVFRTAKLLGLEYGKLKQRAGLPARQDVSGSRNPRPSFLEILAPATATGSECLIEMEGPRGKLRIQWKGATAADVAAFGRTWWESA